MAKAKRYGRWWLLKGPKKEVAGEAGNQQRLREGDTFECSLIIEGEPLYLDNLKQGELPAIAYVCGKKTGVFFEYKNSKKQVSFLHISILSEPM